MPVSEKIFEYRIKVVAENLDDLQHVNNVVYVQFMQDIANRHWKQVTGNRYDEELIWVVRKHEIEYLNQAVLDDVLLMRTWTGEHSAVTWDRHYEMVREADGKKIIAARSVWVMLNKKTGRPQKIDDAICKQFE